MGNVDHSRLWKNLKPYAAEDIRTALNAALANAALPTVGNGGGGGMTPPPPLTTHVLATTAGLSTYHTVSGLTAGQVLKATGAATAAFGQLQHADLGGVTADQHHDKLHEMLDTAHHKYTGGANLDVFGLSAASTLARLTPSADVSAGASALLRSNAGALAVNTLIAAGTSPYVATPRLYSSGSMIIDTATGPLTLTPATYAILSDGKSLRTTSFVSGFAGSGFQLDQGIATASETSMTLDNLTVRGTMNIYELLIHQIRATNGSVIVSSTGKVATRALYSGTEGTFGSQYTLTTDPETAHGFLANDLIRAQRFTGTGTYVSLLYVGSVVDAYTFRGELYGGAAPQIGYEYVRIGNITNDQRRGGLYLSADDDGAPFMDVWDGVAAFTDWGTAAKTKVRIGRLDGITGGYYEYGLWAGTTTNGNVLVTGGKVALRQGTNEVITLAADGTSYFAGPMGFGASGGFYQGSGTFASPTTGLKMWNDSGVGRFATYNTGAQVVGFGTDGKLYTGGGLVVMDDAGLTINKSAGAEDAKIRFNSYWSPAYGSAVIGSYDDGILQPSFGMFLRARDGAGTVRALLDLRATKLYPSGTQTGIATLTADTLALNGAIIVKDWIDTLTTSALLVKQGGTNVLYSTKASADSYLNLGNGRTVDGTATLRLVGDTTYTDAGVILQRYSGANGGARLTHRGTGPLQFLTNEAADTDFYTSGGNLRLSIGSAGLVKVARSLAVGGDSGATTGYITLTNVTAGVSSGSGTVKMNGFTGRDSVGWEKFYLPDGTPAWRPYWTTITG